MNDEERAPHVHDQACEEFSLAYQELYRLCLDERAAQQLYSSIGVPADTLRILEGRALAVASHYNKAINIRLQQEASNAGKV